MRITPTTRSSKRHAAPAPVAARHRAFVASLARGPPLAPQMRSRGSCAGARAPRFVSSVHRAVALLDIACRVHGAAVHGARRQSLHGRSSEAWQRRDMRRSDSRCSSASLRERTSSNGCSSAIGACALSPCRACTPSVRRCGRAPMRRIARGRAPLRRLPVAVVRAPAAAPARAEPLAPIASRCRSDAARVHRRTRHVATSLAALAAAGAVARHRPRAAQLDRRVLSYRERHRAGLGASR